VSNTAIYEYAVTPVMVDAIFNHDLYGVFHDLTVAIKTMRGTTYEIEVLGGGTIPGHHRGEDVSLRKVDYVRTEANGRKSVAKNQYVYFSGPVVPRIRFYPTMVDDEDLESTNMVISPGLLNPDMGLVIDWNKFGA